MQVIAKTPIKEQSAKLIVCGEPQRISDSGIFLCYHHHQLGYFILSLQSRKGLGTHQLLNLLFIPAKIQVNHCGTSGLVTIGRQYQHLILTEFVEVCVLSKPESTCLSLRLSTLEPYFMPSLIQYQVGTARDNQLPVSRTKTGGLPPEETKR